MRRTHSSLQYELGADAQLRADQMGHTVSVTQNEYTRASVDRRREAVNALEERLKIM